MIVSYCQTMNCADRYEERAVLTNNSIVLSESGDQVDQLTWQLFDFRLVDGTDQERIALEEWLDNTNE